MTDQQNNGPKSEGRRKIDRRAAKAPDYNGTEKRKADRRTGERRSEPRE